MTQPEAEALLAEGRRRQLDCYARADAIAREMADGLARGEDPTARLQSLNAALEEVASVEAGLAPVKELWQRQGYQPGPQLRSLRQRLQAAAQGLAERVAAAQHQAEARRELLRPQLDELARVRKMQRAYRTAPRP
jgi:hypothetical protein